ncbi:hypothetical protein R1flu_019752 [Riccia fluitans]|uniref:Sulfotransferase n=1 Tax=Riccia fluitans TaxID=41844 RepID=A0ABD1ZN20_9MARC
MSKGKFPLLSKAAVGVHEEDQENFAGSLAKKILGSAGVPLDEGRGDQTGQSSFEGLFGIVFPCLRIMDLRCLAIICVFMFVSANCATPGLDKERCELLVRSWAEKELAAPQTEQKLTLRDLLFFLHIPRTGGRTYYQCFLKQLFGSGERCPKSYDKLRFDTSQPGCRLISTHDDYSIMEKLPHGKASVVTNLRDPVSRVLSNYEFSVEVAARFLRHYKRRTNIRRPGPGRTNTRLISTLDIWPWKYLVPFMQNEIFSRREAREGEQLITNLEVQVKNSYDVDSLVMPLHEFIHHPIAHELVHNGATLQVAGLTNNSYVKEAKEIRACVVDFEHLGRWVLDVAKRRLDDMIYVGLTDRQEESVLYFANILRGQISSQEGAGDPQKTDRRLLNDQHMTSVSRKTSSNDGKRLYTVETLQSSDANSTSETMIEDVIGQVLESYHGCVKDLRYTQENRRKLSLELIPPINFTTKDRKLIPESLLDQVRRLNSLDVELHSHAQLLFAKQQDSLPHGRYEEFLEVHKTQEKPPHVSSEQMVTVEKQMDIVRKQMDVVGKQIDVAEKEGSPWDNMQEFWGSYCGAFAFFATLSAVTLFIHILRKKKSVRGLTPVRVRYPLFMKVHEKI